MILLSVWKKTSWWLGLRWCSIRISRSLSSPTMVTDLFSPWCMQLTICSSLHHTFYTSFIQLTANKAHNFLFVFRVCEKWLFLHGQLHFWLKIDLCTHIRRACASLMYYVLSRRATFIAVKYHDSMSVVPMYILYIQTGQNSVICCLVGSQQFLQECVTIKDIHHVIWVMTSYTRLPGD